MQNLKRPDDTTGAAALAGRSVLVTGASGFIGSRLVEQLSVNGVSVAAVAHTRGVAVDSGSVRHLSVDVVDAHAVRDAITAVRPQVVFHLAAIVDLERSLAMADACIRVNLLGTVNLLQALETTRLSAFVLASTTEVYGRGPVPFQEEQPEAPPSPYAVSKVAAERVTLMQHGTAGLPATIMRIATTYGPGQPRQRLIPSLIEAYGRGEAPLLSNPEHRRDFVFVDDVVEGLIAAATSEQARGEIVNLGNDTTHSIQQVAETVRELMRSEIAPRYGSLPSRLHEAPVWASNREKAGRLLGWAPRTPLVEGLDRTIASFGSGIGCVAPRPR